MFLVFVRAAPLSSSSPLHRISESRCRTTGSPWCFDPVSIHSYSRSGLGFDLGPYMLTLTLLDDHFSS